MGLDVGFDLLDQVAVERQFVALFRRGGNLGQHCHEEVDVCFDEELRLPRPSGEQF